MISFDIIQWHYYRNYIGGYTAPASKYKYFYSIGAGLKMINHMTLKKEALINEYTCSKRRRDKISRNLKNTAMCM
jgi:hypothetical protein